MAEADARGDWLYAEAIRLNLKDKHGAKKNIFRDREGARGEKVFAKATGLRWIKGRPNDPDVGEFEVRTADSHSRKLIVRQNAKKHRPYALVTGTGPHFIIWGWLMGADAMQPKWWDAPMPVEEGEEPRPPAFFVPHDALRSIDEIAIPFPKSHWTDAWLDDPEAKWEALRSAHMRLLP